MPSIGMHCSSIEENQHHQTKILDVLIFSELVANKGYFWSETTVIFFKKLQKMCILAMLKSNRKNESNLWKIVHKITFWLHFLEKKGKIHLLLQ